jgi:hypothetical protein
MAPVFTSPQYSKTVNPKTGQQEPSYKIDIEFKAADEKLSFVAESESEITLNALQKCVIDNLQWWNIFVNAFLTSTSKYFSKPYTVEHINKIAKHTLNGAKPASLPANVILTPSHIQITGGTFMIHWNYSTERVMIDIPDLTETNTIELPDLPDSTKEHEGVEELNIDEIPVGGNSTEELEIDSPAKFYEKQRVKEARLRAKLALYKAQRQTAQYYEKYGEDISDSDSDFETSADETSDSEEEVQL